MSISEKEFTDQVLKLAKLLGWRTAHFRPARTANGSWRTPVQGDGKGFKDLILVKSPVLLAPELKVGKNKMDADQLAWHSALQGITQVIPALWRPEDWNEIERILKGQR